MPLRVILIDLDLNHPGRQIAVNSFDKFINLLSLALRYHVSYLVQGHDIYEPRHRKEVNAWYAVIPAQIYRRVFREIIIFNICGHAVFSFNLIHIIP